MYKIKLLISALMVCTYAYAWAEEIPESSAVAVPAAQEEPVAKKISNPPDTLISIKDINLSGYGAFYSRFSQVGDTGGWFFGGRGGLIINDHFSMGGGGMGLGHPRDRERVSGDDYEGLYDKIDFGYGGFLAEYYLNPKSLIVFSTGVLVGGGNLSFSNNEEDDDDDYEHEGNDNFFVAEPELNVFVNITRFCRVGIGVSYRYVSGIDSEDFRNKDFSGPAVSAMVQYGWF